MKRLISPNRLFFVHLLAACLAVVVCFPAQSARSEGPSIRQFVQIKWPRAGRLAPNGNFFFIHNPDGLNQLYFRTPRNAEPTKLTDFPDGISSYTLSPDAKWITVSAAIGGNEQSDIYLMETMDGSMRALLAHPDVVYSSITWRRDSGAFAFKANDKSRSDFYVYIYDLESNSTRQVLAQPGDTSPVDFSSDGSRLVCRRYLSSTHSELYEVTFADGKSRLITPKGEEWAFSPIGYSAGDATFLTASDYEGDKSVVVEIDLSTGEMTRPFPKLSDYVVDYGVFNEKRDILALCLNEDGYGNLHLFRMPAKKPLKLPDLPRGIVRNVDFTGAQMLYSVDNANTPGAIYRWSTAHPESPPLPMSKVDDQGIDLSKFELPKLVRYQSFDGLQVPAFLYLPSGYQEGRKIPFIVSYHGGPEAQFRPVFNYLISYFVSRGFGVLAPNVRGSSGYGKAYLEMDNYKKRMDSVKDGIEAARWLVRQGYSTPSQIAAFGGSYGGFMVMACITEAPDAFGAACNIVGICNMQTFLERTKDYRRKLREAEYGPLEDTEFLRSISPIYKVDRIQCPLLIAHGANDPRVPLYEAEQLYEKMKKLDKKVELLVFPDEGHGFAKEHNRITFAERVVAFFNRHLTK